jgi:hypothetical protein
VNAVAQYDLSTLLVRAGAQSPRYGRGKWRCPKHTGSPSLSVDTESCLFNCHHAGCDFHGSAATLARQLGLTRRLSWAEYRDIRQSRERADRAARALYERAKMRWSELLDHLHTLDRLEIQAHDGGPNCPTTWGALALVYAQRPGALAELALLENAGAAELVRFLSAGGTAREVMLAKVIERGGVTDSRRRFVELAL